jgi:hypothetical protein
MTLAHAHDTIQSSIQALVEWHEKNHALIEKHIKADDLKNTRPSSKKGKKR